MSILPAPSIYTSIGVSTSLRETCTCNISSIPFFEKFDGFALTQQRVGCTDHCYRFGRQRGTLDLAYQPVQTVDFAEQVLAGCLSCFGADVVLRAQALQSSPRGNMYNTLPTGVPHVFFGQTFPQTSLRPRRQRWKVLILQNDRDVALWVRDACTVDVTAVPYPSPNCKFFEHKLDRVADVYQMFLYQAFHLPCSVNRRSSSSRHTSKTSPS